MSSIQSESCSNTEQFHHYLQRDNRPNFKIESEQSYREFNVKSNEKRSPPQDLVREQLTPKLRLFIQSNSSQNNSQNSLDGQRIQNEMRPRLVDQNDQSQFQHLHNSQYDSFGLKSSFQLENSNQQREKKDFFVSDFKETDQQDTSRFLCEEEEEDISDCDREKRRQSENQSKNIQSVIARREDLEFQMQNWNQNGQSEEYESTSRLIDYKVKSMSAYIKRSQVQNRIIFHKFLNVLNF